jgi:hypothetical protein
MQKMQIVRPLALDWGKIYYKFLLLSFSSKGVKKWKKYFGLTKYCRTAGFSFFLQPFLYQLRKIITELS